jgi:hypothetical protein
LFDCLVFGEGLSGSLFSDSSKPPGEATARLTLRTDRISAQPFVNGNIIVLMQSGGTYDLYFDSEPRGDRTWDNPATFSSGRRIATFTRTPPLLILGVPTEFLVYRPTHARTSAQRPTVPSPRD